MKVKCFQSSGFSDVNLQPYIKTRACVLKVTAWDAGNKTLADRIADEYSADAEEKVGDDRINSISGDDGVHA